MRKRIIALILLVMLAAALAAAAFISVLLNSPPEGSINPRYFEVPPGEYFSTVAERLEDEGVIRSALFIRLQIGRAHV
jgi:cell division protein YceG involved in septum cleavage